MIDAAGAMVKWVSRTPAGGLAAHLMPAFGPGAGAQNRNGTVDLFGFYKLLGYQDDSVRGPILEAVQLLEHAELILIADISDSGTRFGAPPVSA